MPNYFIKNSQIKNDRIEIIGELSKHLRDSLRIKKGERIVCIDEEKNKYNVIITYVGKEMITGTIIEKSSHIKTHDVSINLVQAIPKGPKFDFIIQKSTELGVSTITPVISERCVVKLEKGQIPDKLMRWRKIALEAAQQSNRRDVPEIKTPVTFTEFLSLYENPPPLNPLPQGEGRLEGIPSIPPPLMGGGEGEGDQRGFSGDKGDLNILLWEGEKEKEKGIKELLRNASGIKSVAVVIGPEGGFSENEVKIAVEKGFTSVSLGESILRTETAPIVILSIVTYEFGYLG